MSFKDFATHFQRVELCNLSPDLGVDEDSDIKAWESKLLEGSWKKKVTAGGCRNFMGQFIPNFAFHFTPYEFKVDVEVHELVYAHL